MTVLVDITGHTFGRWTVIRRAPNKGRDTAWRCRCTCGRFANIRSFPLRNGLSLSCGCLAWQLSSENNRTHGWKQSETYKVWRGMRERCHLRTRKDWKRYGGRGIMCCDRWESFENFLADMGPRPERMTLERINVNGHYEPENCRWATVKDQANNRTTNRILHAFGESKTAKQWSEDRRCSIGYDALLKRLSLGWDEVSAITAPNRHRRGCA